jgi:unsaturated chondroitin disaccharide hydrolase
MEQTLSYQQAYELCVAKIRANLPRMADEVKSFAWAVDGDYFQNPEGFYEIGNWTTSFFTGMAALAFETSRDPFFLQQLYRLAESYERKLAEHGMDTMHDLGFLYVLYSVALFRQTGDRRHRHTALRAADELARRFDLTGGYIRAWGRMDEEDGEYAGLAIIDCLMNLPLLFWAAAATGYRFYRDIAVKHVDTALRFLIRDDASVYHAYRFDPRTGAAVGGANYCGYGIESHWARGTAWAIYGFALAYGYTGDLRYLETARKLAAKFLECLDAEWVPVWDFRLRPDEPPLRDSSAAAVAVCAFYELLKHDPADTLLARPAEQILTRLCAPEYLDSDASCSGLLKRGQIGNGSGKARYAYTSWGDYFFMEALARKVHGVKGYW